MNTVLFQKGLQWQSNTRYLGDKPEYHFFLDEAVFTTEPAYRAPSPACLDHLRVAFLLKGLTNVTLDFNGARLVFHGRITPFILDNCQNVVLKNFSVDYDRPFYTQAEILDFTPDRLKMKIHDRFPYRMDGGYLVATSATWENYLNEGNLLLQLYDRETLTTAPFELILALIGDEIHIPPYRLPLPIHHLRAARDGENVVLAGDFPQSWKSGYDLVITHERRDKNSFTALNCRDVLVENVRILHGASLAFIGMHSENITLRHFDMYTDEQSAGLISNNADAVHTFNCLGQLRLESCRMESMLDDCLNVHGNFGEVTAVSGNMIRLDYGRSQIGVSFGMVCPGETLAFCRGRTREELSARTVLEAREVGPYVMEVRLDGPASGVSAGDVAENLTAQAQTEVLGCNFGKYRGTMRLQTRAKTLVDRCRFYNDHLSILASGDVGTWWESSPLTDACISNCEFCSTAGPQIKIAPEFEFTDQAPFYHRNITVRDNLFHGSYAIDCSHADGLAFIGNRSAGGEELRIRASHSSRIVLDNARLEGSADAT